MNLIDFISGKAAGLRFTLRALKYKNYRLFFAGQSISLTGSWMQMIAVSWLAYRLTNSAFLLGVIGFISQIPAFILAPFAGVLADRWHRKHILIATQTLAMIQAFIFAVLAFLGVMAVWQIIALSAFMGLVNAFDMPVRQAFVIDMVEKRSDLGNAIALNSLIFNAARLIGPSVAGIVIAAVGEKVCFLINGISFLAVIAALLSMKIKINKRRDKYAHILLELKDGFDYAFGSLPIRYILLLVTLVSLMGMSYAVLMPIFAKDILRGGAHTLGFLMGATGFGAFIGAVYLASKKDLRGLDRIIPAAAAIFGFGLIAFSFTRFIWLSLFFMVCAGFGMMAQTVSSNTLLQNLTDDDKRGRVMSFYTIAFAGMMPFGSLLAGGLAAKIGAPNTLLISGFCCVFGAFLFFIKVPHVERAIETVETRGAG